LKNNDKKVIEVLTQVIARMKLEAEYQGFYSAYLLGQIGEDEFEDLSEEFIDPIHTEELDDSNKEKIDILLEYTKIKYTPTEISDLFFIDDKIVEEYLEQKNEA